MSSTNVIVLKQGQLRNFIHLDLVEFTAPYISKFNRDVTST